MLSAGQENRREEMEGTRNRWKLGFNPPWQPESYIGAGGFGEVFKAASPRNNGIFWAVKRVRKDRPVTKPTRDWILSEIAISAELTGEQPESFVKFYGWNEDDQHIFLAMEYLEPGDLEGHLKPSWTEEDTRVAIRQVLVGLEFMHGRGITHRDLKPLNILLVSMNPIHVKIGDFGISKRVPRDSSTVLRTGVGTRAYMAPEITDSRPYTSVVDLWSLGCIIYRMIVGRLLFHSVWVAVDRSDQEIAHSLERITELSPDGLDIMKKLIIKDVQGRLTAEQALQHPWVSRTM